MRSASGALELDELLIDRDFGRRAAPPEWGRNVLIVPEGTLLRPEPRLKPILDDLVEHGGRVIALGRASRWIARTCRLPVDRLALEPAALPGTSLRTRVAAAAVDYDPLLWGYRGAPNVLFHRGPLWRPARAAPDEGDGAFDRQDVLEIDPEQPLACGLLDARYAPLVSGAVPLVRVGHPRRRESGSSVDSGRTSAPGRSGRSGCCSTWSSRREQEDPHHEDPKRRRREEKRSAGCARNPTSDRKERETQRTLRRAEKIRRTLL